jgi:hypothetical protein
VIGVLETPVLAADRHRLGERVEQGPAAVHPVG